MDKFRIGFVVLAGSLTLLHASPLLAGDVALATTKLRVMTQGLGSGKVVSTAPGIDCGQTCDATFRAGEAVTLKAIPDAGSKFVRWEGDVVSESDTCMVTMDIDRSLRARFELTTDIPPIEKFSPEELQEYLEANPIVDRPGRFVRALPEDFKQNWILMTRSESLQTGTADRPRVLLPDATTQYVFTVGLATHVSYPGSHPNAIEYMQWDPSEKNFRFHEIMLADIPEMSAKFPDGTTAPTFPARPRGVSIDDRKCSKCHSTQNVLNKTGLPGTTDGADGLLKAKNKPNWDAYDSWGGMMPFNRDRIFQGSVEAAAFRKLLNPWTWRDDEVGRAVIEQLVLQNGTIPQDEVKLHTNGGTHDGHVEFAFDLGQIVSKEPGPVGSEEKSSDYGFDGKPGTGVPTSVVRGGDSALLHDSPLNRSDEGRAVQLFDLLGGLDSQFNAQRIADELIDHRRRREAVDVRAIALAIARGLITIDPITNLPTSSAPTTPLEVDLSFFDARNGMTLGEVYGNTFDRAKNLTRRKADIQRINLDRSADPYLSDAPAGGAAGLIETYGRATEVGPDVSPERVRQEVFRRLIEFPGKPDQTVMQGLYVDRELHGCGLNTERVALYRYFLEPLGVSVDKWSMGVRGRSRTYTFADVFGNQEAVIAEALAKSLTDEDRVTGLTDPADADQLIAAVNATLASLPQANEPPDFVDVQRIFNKSCIECHGGLNYPPISNSRSTLDLSENENPGPGETRLSRSESRATSSAAAIQRRITVPDDLSLRLMPYGGPKLSLTDIKTIERWIDGGSPSANGDPHLVTVDGVKFDFHAAGEFVFLQSDGLELQVRLTPVETEGPALASETTGLPSCLSLITAIAVRIGKTRVTFQPNLDGRGNPEGLELRIDGNLVALGDEPIPLPGGARVERTIAPGGIRIVAPGGTNIVATPGRWEARELWYMNVDMKKVRATRGALGRVARGEWLPALPDGRNLGAKPDDPSVRHRVLYREFGDAWRVKNFESLFDYAEGKSTDDFTLADWPGEGVANSCGALDDRNIVVRGAPQAALTADVANDLAGAIQNAERRRNAIRDMQLTGERSFAQTYSWAERIAANSPPSPPELISPGFDAKDLDLPVRFEWKPSTDPDGDEVVYLHSVWQVDALPDDNLAASVANGEGETRTRIVGDLEPGKAYLWKVSADDGKGGIAESDTWRIEIGR